MSNQTVNRLWRSQSKSWFRWMMIALILIGWVTAMQTTQSQHSAVTMTRSERVHQAKDYRQHPKEYRVHGKAASLAAYNDNQDQFFLKISLMLREWMWLLIGILQLATIVSSY